MSHKTVHDRRFVKTTRGYLPIALIGYSEIQRDETSTWCLILGSGKGARSEGDLLAEAGQLIPASADHRFFRFRQEWLDGEGWLRFVSDGIAGAQPLERILDTLSARHLAVYLRAEHGSWHTQKAFCTSKVRNTAALEQALDRIEQTRCELDESLITSLCVRFE